MSEPVTLADGQGGSFTAVVGLRTPHADGYGQLAFFWHDDRFLGWDSLNESSQINAIRPAGSGRVRVEYAHYSTTDALCCPSLPPVTIAYRWDGQRLVAEGTPPDRRREPDVKLVAQPPPLEPEIPLPAPSPHPPNYGGGPVMHHPEVNVIVWGPGYPTGTLDAATGLITSLGGSGYAKILSQYGDSHDHVHNDVSLHGVWTDPLSPSGVVTIGLLQLEIERAKQQTGWTAGPDTLFVVLLGPGTTLDSESCGFHFVSDGGTGATAPSPTIWAVVTFPSILGRCSGIAADDAAAVTYILSHEVAEAITDPEDNGWSGFGSGASGEVGDSCPQGFSFGPFWVTELWSAKDNGCRQAD